MSERFAVIPTGTDAARAFAAHSVETLDAIEKAGLVVDLDTLCLLMFAVARRSRTPMKRVCAALMEYETRNGKVGL